MQKGHFLEFPCSTCKTKVKFSLLELSKKPEVVCTSCSTPYTFADKDLQRQLKCFNDLCAQLLDSQEILSQTSVGIDVGDHHVKIPFKLLLTRLNSQLDLKINGEVIPIAFRFEPLKGQAV